MSWILPLPARGWTSARYVCGPLIGGAMSALCEYGGMQTRFGGYVVTLNMLAIVTEFIVGIFPCPTRAQKLNCMPAFCKI